jgi:hypothetical protein
LCRLKSHMAEELLSCESPTNANSIAENGCRFQRGKIFDFKSSYADKLIDAVRAKEEVSARARRREALHNRVGDLEKTVAELKNAVDPPLQKRLKAIERKLEQMPQMRRVA